MQRQDITTPLASAAAKRSLAKDSASRVQSGARSSYAEAQPVFAGTVKLAPPPSARSARWALTLIIALLTTATAWAWDESGTSADPYLIKTKADLNQLASDVNSDANLYANTYFRLEANLDYTGETYTPIGCDYYNKTFQGNFDGNGKTISGITVSRTGNNSTADSYVGRLNAL